MRDDHTSRGCRMSPCVSLRTSSFRALLVSLALLTASLLPSSLGSPMASPRTFKGALTIMTGDLPDDSDIGSEIIFMLYDESNSMLYDLFVPPTLDHASLNPGAPVRVTGTLTTPHTIQVISIQPLGLTQTTTASASSDISSRSAEDVAAAATVVARAAEAAAAMVQPRVAALVSGASDGPVKPALAAGLAAQMTYTRVVRGAPTLFMILSICRFPAAVTKEQVERTLFAGPGSNSLTLEGYFYDCSRGKAAMNRANSLVVGPVYVPCTGTAAGFNFNTSACPYRNAWSWHTFAQQTLANNTGLDLSRFRHRVAILPLGFTNEANCPWMGLGTLGPNSLLPDGSYGASMAWIQGESAGDIMAYMHEMGHNLYLHHANGSTECEYCDWSSVMGGCCAVRCHNAPHNWQLGWGVPLAVLNGATLPVGTYLYFNLPAQHASGADANIIVLQPDWADAGRRELSTPVSYYLSYRIDSGKYDADMPEVYLYATNVYWWDGSLQTSVRRTRYVSSVFTGEEWRSVADGVVVRQLAHSVGGSRIGVCRYTQERETSCSDGIDNDCDGLADRNDPDCTEPSPPPLQPPTPPSPPHKLTKPPSRYSYPAQLGGAEPPDAEPQDVDDTGPPAPRARPPHPASPPPPPLPSQPPPPATQKSSPPVPVPKPLPPPSPSPKPPPPSPSPQPSPPSPSSMPPPRMNPKPPKRSPPPPNSPPRQPPPKSPKKRPPPPSPAPLPPPPPKTARPPPLPPPRRPPPLPKPSPCPKSSAKSPPPAPPSPAPSKPPPAKQPLVLLPPPPIAGSHWLPPSPPPPLAGGKRRSPAPPKARRAKGRRRLAFQLDRDSDRLSLL